MTLALICLSGNIETKDEGYRGSVQVNESATFRMSNGTINSTLMAIETGNAGNTELQSVVSISGGDITGNIEIGGSASLIMTGGSVRDMTRGYDYRDGAILGSKHAKLKIENVTISSDNGVGIDLTESATLEMTNCKIDANTNGLKLGETGNGDGEVGDAHALIKGGNIVSKSADVIYAFRTSSVTIEDGTFTGISGRGMLIKGEASLDMSGGTVTGSNTALTLWGSASASVSGGELHSVGSEPGISCEDTGSIELSGRKCHFG